jgi:hypothetical protein
VPFRWTIDTPRPGRQSPAAVPRLLALLLAILVPGLPLARAASMPEKPGCAMHRAIKQLPCHETASAASPQKHDCCKATSFARDACTCGHGDEASGVTREPSLAPVRARFALALAETRLLVREPSAPLRLADPPDPHPPSVRS